MKSSRFAGIPFMLMLLPFCAQAATPKVLSVSPSSGSGQTQVFTVTASDDDGAADISSVELIVGDTLYNLTRCWVAYNHFTKHWYLQNDQGLWFTGVNSQCEVQGISATDSGNLTTVAFTLSFNGHWTGDRIVSAGAGDRSGNNIGYQQMGTYTIVAAGPVPDFTVVVTQESPPAEPGLAARYKVVLTSINGFTGSVIFVATADPQVDGLQLVTRREDGKSQYFLSVPANGTATGYLDAQTSGATPLGGNITLTMDFTYQHTVHTYQVPLAVLPSAPPQISLSPTSGSGVTQTFTVTAADQRGYKGISGINFLVNSGFDGTHACWLYYDNQQSKIMLASDDSSDWSNSTGIGPGSDSTQSIQNSQCALPGGLSSVSGDGNTLTVVLTLTFSSSFTGPKQIWVRAGDTVGTDSGYEHLGDWTR
jgi:hypothetical protein